MIIYKLPDCTIVPSLPEGAVLALGNFDGVHRGHQCLFETAREMCGPDAGTACCVWTFDSLAKAEDGAACLTDMNAKLALFSEYGLDYAVFESFDEIRHLSCADFVSRILSEGHKAGGVVCGFNFRFGNGGEGDADLLCALCDEKGISHRVVPPVAVGDIVVSSTKIRELIQGGDMEGAYELLGHPYSISFPVVHGNEIGRKMGIPTINQSFAEGHCIPGQGIYACTVFVDGGIYLGVANVGVRPTVSNGTVVNCETHIINYSGDLYGREIKVEFYERLREEMKFDSIDALRRQIKIDISECLDYFCQRFGS
ncbi:MAG: bifunctional riboflavin kinase/FAD synthetase [Clostridia bacterium]|nr:bifunctional riboflavin kinase/FAD synthetase [Clostridia bacterium]